MAGPALNVSYAARRPWVPRPAEFARWARAAWAELGARAPGGGGPLLDIRGVGEAMSRRLNTQWRRRAHATNVLSFAGAGVGPDGRRHLGELVICAPVLAREARLQGKTRPSHWAHITVHGLLHLAGFDHQRPAAARKMEALEIQILDRLGFSNPYA